MKKGIYVCPNFEIKMLDVSNVITMSTGFNSDDWDNKTTGGWDL